MKLNELNFVLDEAKLLGKQNFVYHNKSKRLFIVLATHVRRGHHNRHVKLMGYPDPNSEKVNKFSYTTGIGEFLVPIDRFQSEFTKVEDPDMFRILYEKSSI